MLKVEQLQANIAGQPFQWDLQLPAKQMLAITGASGVGKSTLLNVLLGFKPASGGRVYWQDESVLQQKTSARPFGVLFQKDNLFEHLSVERNLAFGLQSSGKISDKNRDLIKTAAARFQLNNMLAKKCMNLSGGQQQRVALARVFLQNKPILLLDEPFSSLDPELREQGLEWVVEMQKEQGTTVLMVTHHLNEVEHVADQILEGVSSTVWKQYISQT